MNAHTQTPIRPLQRSSNVITNIAHAHTHIHTEKQQQLQVCDVSVLHSGRRKWNWTTTTMRPRGVANVWVNLKITLHYTATHTILLIYVYVIMCMYACCLPPFHTGCLCHACRTIIIIIIQHPCMFVGNIVVLFRQPLSQTLRHTHTDTCKNKNTLVFFFLLSSNL